MGPVEQQAERHVEAYRRAHPNREIPEGEPGHDVVQNAGLRIGPSAMSSGDVWSLGGGSPGTMTPDLQGPEPPLHPVTETPRVETPHNMEDIIRGGRR
jgi:hypothetical protein